MPDSISPSSRNSLYQSISVLNVQCTVIIFTPDHYLLSTIYSTQSQEHRALTDNPPSLPHSSQSSFLPPRDLRILYRPVRVLYRPVNFIYWRWYFIYWRWYVIYWRWYFKQDGWRMDPIPVLTTSALQRLRGCPSRRFNIFNIHSVQYDTQSINHNSTENNHRKQSNHRTIILDHAVFPWLHSL